MSSETTTSLLRESFFHFDKKRWPIIVLTIRGKPVNDEDFDNFLETWKLIYIESMTKGERYKLIFDTRLAQMVKLDYLSKLGTWLKDIKDLTERWMDKTAIIVSNQSIQLLIQFVFRIYKAVRPFKIFNGKEDLSKAILWLNNDDKGDLELFDKEVADMDEQMKNNMIKKEFKLN